MEKIVRVWIGNDYVEYEVDADPDMTEDEFYEAVVDDVFSTISIEIL